VNGLRPIREWHFVISGFTQREGASNGWSKLWRKLNKLSTDICCVECKTWKQPWSDVAELVEEWRANDRDPVVNIYGYSFGGCSAVLLARELKRRDLSVTHMLLADPVFRWWNILGAWRSMMPFSRIVVPENVRQVTWFRQRNPRFAFTRDGAPCGLERFAQPAGHDVIAADPTKTLVGTPQILACEHVYVDDHPAVHAAALQLAGVS
jgi:pimeloyl-ACP methyl ester carboxylesterase